MYILYRQFILFSLILLFQQFPVLNGQNLDSLLMEQMEESTEFTTATFKATRILNGHSIERTNEGQLDFRISHRFGTINSGAYEFFGLDQAHIHLSLEYGIRDWLMVGIGRGTFEKTVNGFTKFSILRQSKGLRTMPVSLSYMTGIYVNGLKLDNPDNTIEFHHRLSFVHQIQIARKFTPGFSFGWAYHWSQYLDRENSWDLGVPDNTILLASKPCCRCIRSKRPVCIGCGVQAKTE